MLERLHIPQQELYDGLEDGFWTQTFALPVDDISFRVTDLHEGSFRELQARLGDAAFEQVIAEAGIELHMGTYAGVHRLPLGFLVRGGCLFVFAIGELSAGRYSLTLQGAWRFA